MGDLAAVVVEEEEEELLVVVGWELDRVFIARARTWNTSPAYSQSEAAGPLF
jgi:hypothetical protein